MKYKNVALSVVIFFALSMSGANATANLTNVFITNIHINKSMGDFVFIRTSVAPTITGCHTDPNWNLVLPLETELDNKIYAGLLAAQAAQTKVILVGTGNCNAIGIEYLEKMSIIKF